MRSRTIVSGTLYGTLSKTESSLVIASDLMKTSESVCRNIFSVLDHRLPWVPEVFLISFSLVFAIMTTSWLLWWQVKFSAKGRYKGVSHYIFWITFVVLYPCTGSRHASFAHSCASWELHVRVWWVHRHEGRKWWTLAIRAWWVFTLMLEERYWRSGIGLVFWLPQFQMLLEQHSPFSGP